MKYKCISCNKLKEKQYFNLKKDGQPYKKCTDCYNTTHDFYKRLKEESVFKYYNYCKSKQCEKESIPFNLTPEHLEEIWTGVCPISGATLDFNSLSQIGDIQKPQLDRIVPSQGYTIGNVIWLSSRANRLKSDITIEEAKQILSFLEQYND